jgi:omega-amidase
LNIKIAVCQIKVLKIKEKNLRNAEKMIREASKNDSQIIILPEMFNCPYSNNYFPVFAESYPGETTNLLSSLARELETCIIGGSIPEKEGNKIYNTSYSFDKNGKLIGKHRKIHLFDVDIENGIKFRESAVLSGGNSATIFDTSFCRIGVAICYDMRFPELIRKMSLLGAKLIIIPAAFNMTTGPAHWHLIARSRALDNQVFFIAASPARNPGDTAYISYGHSLITNPWGEIIAEAGIGQCILYSIIDMDFLERIRNQLPVLKHRREKIYKIER